MQIADDGVKETAELAGNAAFGRYASPLIRQAGDPKTSQINSPRRRMTS